MNYNKIFTSIIEIGINYIAINVFILSEIEMNCYKLIKCP